MTHTRLTAVCAAIVCVAWCNRLIAQPGAPDSILASKGLTRSGSCYLLDNDLKLPEWLRLTRAAKRRLDENLKKRGEIEASIKLADSSVEKWDADVAALEARHERVKAVPFEYNEVGAEINTLLGKIREAMRFKADREAELRKLGEPPDDYVGLLLDLSDKMDATAKAYESLSHDAGVNGALARLNEKGSHPVRLGPSPQFAGEWPHVQAQRRAISSAAIKLTMDGGVPHVQATLNGKVSRPFVVDSGAAVVTITAELAQDLGLMPPETSPTVSLRAADGAEIRARLIVLDSVRVGQFTADEVRCAVLPKSVAGENLLGGTFLWNFVSRMDLASGELRLSQIAAPQPASPGGPTTRPAAVAGGDTRPAAPAGPNVAAARNFFDADPKGLAPATQPAFATTLPATGPATGPAEAVAGAPARRPLPPATDRQRAAALAGEVFAADLADASPSARRSLADRLLRESETAASDAERFVMLIGAIHAADDARDLPLCFRAIDVLAAGFEVDDLAIRTHVAIGPSLQADSDDQATANCRTAFGLVDRLMAADEFADASRLARVLVRASIVDKPLNGEIKEQAARVETLSASRARLEGDMKKLRAAPTDPAANLAVGKFLCFGVGAWERGLPMLRLGGDARLSAVAKRELDGPADGASQLAVADGWWDAAAAESDVAVYQTEVRRHAAQWYTSALPLLKGLERAKAEVRLRALAPSPAAAAAPPKPAGPIDLLKLVVPERDTVQGTFAFQNGELVSTGTGQQRIEVRYVPPAEYDFEIEFTRYAADGPVIQILSKNGMPFIWVMETKDLVLHYLKEGGDFRPATTIRKPNAILSTVRYRSLVQVRNGRVRTYLNGTLVLDWKTDYTNINPNPPFWHLRDSSFLGLGVVDKVVIHSAKVTEITGKGKLE